ncbi:oligosaccharide flippase family protein [Raoultella ornithinolytica]|uniref:oligosaccharide flippase family protein n=1 Tax=Raoultella ornithinolytica TaxID=54291 RepID=UPI002DBACD82|nr:oligosaccharide flippase family protein [Raoultella ornithinolytica]MEB8237533.1 oligosaccharide flippase family protein [Raoultella ornithinolytica]
MNNKIATNAIWMMVEKIISILGLIFVTSSVAKYVGPHVFGQIALSLSIFQIVQIVAQMGGTTIIFKRISKNPISGMRLLNATFIMRFLLYLSIATPTLLYYIYQSDKMSCAFIAAAYISCFFSTLDVLSIYYDATLKSKINTLINVVGLSLSLALRWLIVLFDFNPIYIAIPIALTGLIPFVLRKIIHRVNSRDFKRTKSNFRYVKYLFFSGANFVVSDISVALYTRLSFFIISLFATKSDIGVYSVSLALGNSWGFINSSIITSFFSKVYSTKNERESLHIASKINILILFIGSMISIATAIIGSYFILFFYGDEFSGAYLPLVILCLSTTVAGLGGVSTRYIVRHSGYLFLSKKMLFTLLVSIVFSIPLIYFYGIIGAAIATLLTEIVSLTIFNYPFKKGLILDLHLSSIKFIFMRDVKK